MPGLDGIICGGLDTRKISADDVLVTGSASKPKVFVKSEVLDKVYNYQGKYYAVLKFNDACFTTLCPGETEYNRALLLLSDSINFEDGIDKTNVSSSGIKTICGTLNDDAQTFHGNAIKAVDATNVNKYGFCPKAIKPTKSAIPVRSNLRTYGPYVSPGFGSSCGGTNAEQDTDLAPWVFGSIAAMNTAGSARVASMLQQFSSPLQETGSYTITGLPTLNLGVNVGMPNLTGISINFGSSGMTTTYNFQTHTNKFGSLSRNFLDKFKTVQKYKQQLLQFKNNLSVQQERSNRKRKIIDAGGGNGVGGGVFDIAGAHRASEQRVFVGEFYEDQNKGDEPYKRTVVSTADLDKTIYELRYDESKKAFMSLDGLFGPVSSDGDGGLPQYAAFSVGCHKASPEYPQPPFRIGDSSSSESFASGLDEHNLEITRIYENPLTNPGSHHHDGDTKGHSIDLVAGKRNTAGVPEKGMILNFYNEQDGDKYPQDYRFLGLRGPMVLHAWGYDTQGKPIPNEADTKENSSQGTFTENGLTDRFLNNWLKDPSTWPVAPIDLRFDRNRGVWVSPPSYKIVVAKLEEDLQEYSTAKAKLINKKDGDSYGNPIYDKDGNEVIAEDKPNANALIRIADRIGKTANKGDLVYCYYDTFNCEYLILEIGESNKIVRFKLVDICPIEDLYYGDAFFEKYGYGDKHFGTYSLFDDGEYVDSYAIRLNCNREPIDKNGKVLNNTDLEDEDVVKQNLIVVRDVVGRWGPAFNRMYDTTGNKASSVEFWKEHAAEGYAIKVSNPKPSGETDPTVCDRRLPCELTYTTDNSSSGDSITVDEEYDILYLESYARIIHGCLTQDLYCSSTFASSEYPSDEWKKARPMGNALLEIDKYYGNSSNGNMPIYFENKAGNLELDGFGFVRVFDPWMVTNQSYDDGAPCYDPKHSIFYHLSEGTNVVAIFNETLKRYEILQASKPPTNIVRFKVIDVCESGVFGDPSDGYDQADSWTKYAGYLDKFPNVHILGVRIDCDGNPVDKNGNSLPTNNAAFQQAISDPERSKDILINLFDNAGSHGPAFATYKTYNEWKQNAFTGYAAKADPVIHDSNCDMGRMVGHCGWVDHDQYESFDILFLESYARFVECTLTQDLYVSGSGSSGGSSQYSDDEYKTQYPDGNAAATDLHTYGDSPNGREPKFYDKDGEEVPFRVFDPFEDVEKAKNPFAILKEGDKVLAIFDETRKKYVIYQSIKKNERVVKFAVAQNKKKFGDQQFYGVLVDALNYPIDSTGSRLDADNFLENRITIRDTFGLRGPDMFGVGTPYTSGPAIGSSIFEEHITGIEDLEYDGLKYGPFLGFALERIYDGPTQNGLAKGTLVYELITLEKFAEFVTGKVGTPSTDASAYYYGAISSFSNGRRPVTRSTKNITKGLNLVLSYSLTSFHGTRSYIVGDFYDGQSAQAGDSPETILEKVDGCEFVAQLDCDASFQTEERLVYNIVETETLAVKGKSIIYDQETAADALNKGEKVKETSDESRFTSTYYRGFQWDKEKSKEHYDKIEIINRDDWKDKPLLVKDAVIYTELLDIASSGNPRYVVHDGQTMARIIEKKSQGGLNASSLETDPEKKKISSNYGDKAYLGTNKVLDLDKPPKIEIQHEWMSYEDGLILCALDEENRSTGKVEEQTIYRVIYAREAPVIITGTALYKFTPKNTSGIKVSPGEASCPNVNKPPIPDPVLQNVSNPLGYGAEEGDSVTVQRVYSNAPMFGNQSNYYYIVIGTGKPPESCSSGGGGSSGS